MQSMKKRGQSISLFIILALLIVIGASLSFYFLTSVGRGAPGTQIVTDQVLTQQAGIVKSAVEDCLEQKAIEAKELYGLREDSIPRIEEMIEEYVPECLDYSLEGTGIKLQDEDIDVAASLSRQALQIDIDYPIKLTNGKNRQELSRFTYYLPLESRAKLELDSYGRTTSEYRLISHDSRLELIIPEGTRVSDATGSPVEEITIRTADRNEGGLVNSVVVGMTLYDGQPDGVKFEPAITAIMIYDPEELMGLPEQDLKIGWYDAQKGFWWGLPSSKVDTANKVISAELSHFTKIGEVGCTSPEEGIAKFSYKTITPQEESQIPGQGEPCPNSGEGAPLLSDPSSTTPDSTRLCIPEGEPGNEIQTGYYCHNSLWYSEPCDPSGCNPEFTGCIKALESEPTIALQIEEAEEQAMPDSCGCLCNSNCRDLTEEELSRLGTGGLGYFSFTIASGGQGCIMETKDGDADIRAEVLGSPGDTMGIAEAQGGITFEDPGAFRNAVIESLIADEALVAGAPIHIYYPIENTNPDGCAWSITRLTINGRGITYPHQCASYSDTGKATLLSAEASESQGSYGTCTVQNAINALCGKGDTAYNDNYPNCEENTQGNPLGFLDPARGPTLRSMISEAQALNPDRWRLLLFSQLPSRDTYMAKMNELRITMVCDSGIGYTCIPYTTELNAGEGSELGAGSSALLGSDPEASSASSSCTAWEKALTDEQVKALIMAKTKEVVLNQNLGDAEYFGSLMIGIAMTESGMKHCADSGLVKTGDGGASIGMMQVNKDSVQCSGTTNYRIGCNIESAVNHLIGKYMAWGCAAGHTLDCRERCQELGQTGCEDEVRLWEGWDCAVRGYNGMGCSWSSPPIYCGTDCNGYVEKVKSYAGIADTAGSEAPVSQISTQIICTSDTAVGNCQQRKGVLLNTVGECDSIGGWPIYSTSDEEVLTGRSVCCRQEGCCIKDNEMEASSMAACTGWPEPGASEEDITTFATSQSGDEPVFEQMDCSEVAGCCVWQDDGCKKASTTKSRCGDKTFFPLETNCKDHPQCEEASLGYSGKCHYCGSNVNTAKQIDPDAECGDRCCTADCPPGTVMVPDTVYYNQCGFGNNAYCGSACGPTSLKMGAETIGIGTQDLSVYWDGCETTSAGTAYSYLNSYACTIGACESSSGLVSPSSNVIESKIDQGSPMVLTVRMYDYYNEGCSTAGGHYVLIVGYSPEYVIINDPYTGGCPHEVGEHLVLTRSLFYNTVLPGHYGIVMPLKRS